MEQTLQESDAKDDYFLEIYLSGGVVRTLLGSVYKQLYINIQKVLEQELESSKKSKDKDKIFKSVLDELEFIKNEQAKQKAFESILKREDFLKNFNKTPEFWLQNLKKQITAIQSPEVLGVGSDMDILYKLSPKLLRKKFIESKKLLETINELVEIDKKRIANLDKAIKNGHTLDKKQWKGLKQALQNFGQLTTKEIKELQQIIYDKSPLSVEQLQVLDLAIINQKKSNEKQWELLPKIIQSGSELNSEQLQKIHRVIKIQHKLNIEDIKQKIQNAGDTFLNSAANFFDVSGIEETLKNSLLPPGDVSEYFKQTKSSMSQGGSALDWLAFELSLKEGKKLIEPPLDLKEKAKLKQSIVESFIHGHYEYLESQIDDSIPRRIASVIRGFRFIFENPSVTLLDATVILQELENIEKHAERDNNGKIVLAPRAYKQLEKLRRNTNFEGAHNLIHRLDPKNIVLLKFLEIIKQFVPAQDGRMNVHLPKYVQNLNPLAQTSATGQYESEINALLIDTKTFIENFTNAGIVYHGTPLAVIPAIMRGGFYISDSTQGMASFGSGLYSTKDRTFALGYSESVLPLHIDTDKKINIINLDKMNAELLQNLQEESRKSGFLDVNELLKIYYKIDIIIHEHVLIQNMAVVKKSTLADLSSVYRTLFEEQFMTDLKVGNESFYLISEAGNLSFQEAHKSFEHYMNLCLLSGTLESSSAIIKNLISALEKIEKTQTKFNLKNTRLFIYAHCFLASPEYVRNNLSDICMYSINNPNIIIALARFTNLFAINFKKKGKEDHHKTLTLVLKEIIPFAKIHNPIICMLESLKLLDSQALNILFDNLIYDGELTQAQMLDAILAASEMNNNVIVLYLWPHINKIDSNKLSQEEQEILDKIFVNAVVNNSIEIINKFFNRFIFKQETLILALSSTPQKRQKGTTLYLLDLAHKREFNVIASEMLEWVCVYAANSHNTDLFEALLAAYKLSDTMLIKALSSVSNAKQKDMSFIIYILDIILKKCQFNEKVLIECLNVISKLKDIKIIEHLLEEIVYFNNANENSIVLKDLEPKVINEIIAASGFNNTCFRILELLLRAGASKNLVLIQALNIISDKNESRLLSYLLDLIKHHKIKIKNVDSGILEKTIADYIYDTHIILKILETFAFEDKLIVHALSCASETERFISDNMFYQLLRLIAENKINLKNVEPMILIKMISKVIKTNENIEALLILLRVSEFNEKLLACILSFASDSDLSQKNALVFHLLYYINNKEIDLKNIDSAVLNKFFINLINNTEISFIMGSKQSLKILVTTLVTLIYTDKVVIKNINEIILNMLLTEVFNRNFDHMSMRVVKVLLSTHRFSSEVLTRAAINADLNGNWSILLELLIENDIDLKNITPFLETKLKAQANHNGIHSYEIINKLLNVYQFNNQVLIDALSNAYYNDNYDSFLSLLNKIDIKNIDGNILKKLNWIISSAFKGDLRFINSLLIKYEFDEQIVASALSSVSNIKDPRKNDIVLYLFDLLNRNKVDLKKINLNMLDDIIFNAAKCNDLDFIKKLLTACHFNDSILTQALNAIADLNIRFSESMKDLLVFINKAKIDLQNKVPVALENIFIKALKNDAGDIIEELLAQYAFSQNFLQNALTNKLKTMSINSIVELQRTEAILLSILNTYEFEDSEDFVQRRSNSFSFDYFNGSLLEFACCIKMDKLAMSLLERKSNLSQDLNKNKKSAFMYACENLLKYLVMKMIEQKVALDQIYVNYESLDSPFMHKEKIQKTPLIAALRAGHPEIALILIQAGVKNFNLQYNIESSKYPHFSWLPDNALDIAIKKGYIEVAKEIIKKSMQEQTILYEELSNFQHTVNVACQLGNLELIYLLINSDLCTNQAKQAFKLEDIIERIYSELRFPPYNAEKTDKVITHLLDYSFVCPEAFYEAVIKNLDADILLKIFETRQAYRPNSDEEKLSLLKKLNKSYDDMNWLDNLARNTKYSNLIFKLLDKG